MRIIPFPIGFSGSSDTILGADPGAATFSGLDPTVTIVPGTPVTEWDPTLHLGWYSGGGAAIAPAVTQWQNYLGGVFGYESFHFHHNAGFNPDLLNPSDGTYQLHLQKMIDMKNVHPDVTLSVIFRPTPRGINQSGVSRTSFPGWADYDEIANGQWDSQIEDICANFFLASGQTNAHIRLMHEWDASSSTITINGYTESQKDIAVAAFQRCHDLWENVNPGGFTWQNSLNGAFLVGATPAIRNGQHFFDWQFPGSAYVDELSCSLYDRGANQGQANRIGRMTYMRDKAIQYGTKFGFAEWGLDITGGGNNAQFLTDCYNFFTDNLDLFSYALYFNNHSDFNITQFSTSIQNQFKDLFAYGA